MEKLKGKTILIGKEPGQGRLLVAIEGGKAAAIGAPSSVPGSVSRCKTAEGIAHAKITIDQNGNMVLTNMKSQNVTFVNGSEIVSKRILSTNKVELGKDHFNINLPIVLETAKKVVLASYPSPSPSPASPAPPASDMTFGIRHLERVWNKYHDELFEIKERQRKQQLYARLPMFFTMGGGAISFVLSFILGDEYKGEIQILSGVLVVVGLAMLVYSFMKSRSDTALEDQEKASEAFQDRYVCPNPECNKFLGNLSYKLMKRQYSMQCPYCRCKFVEK